MPPAVAVAGVTAAGALGSAVLQNKSSKRATQAQERANAAALGFERERYGQENTYRQQALDDYTRRWNAWDAGRRAIFKQYGIDLLPSGGALTPGGTPMPPAGGGGGGAPAMGGGPPMTLGLLAGRPDTLGGLTGAEDETALVPDDATDWNDWRKYGLR